MHQKRLSRFSLALFVSPALPLAAIGIPLGVYLPSYYADHVGVSFTAVGLAFMLVRLFDMAFDPIIGSVMDRSRWRFGRFKPWMIGATPILMLGIYMLFLPFAGAGAFHLWLSLAILYAGYSICQLSQVSWASTLSVDYDDRSRIYAWWQASSALGALAIVALPVVLTRIFGYSHTFGIQAMGLTLVVAVPICVAIATRFVAEMPAGPAKHGHLLGDYRRVMQSVAVRRIVFSDVLLATAVGVTGAMFFFFFRHVKGLSDADASASIFFFMVASLVGAPIWQWAAVRWSKHVALIIATVTYIIALSFVGLALEGGLWAMATGMFLIGLNNSAPQLLLRAMMADAADEIRLETGEDSTGVLFGIVTAINKAGNALAIGITFVCLGVLGYSPDMAGRPETAPLYFIYVGIPVLMCIGGIMLLRGYPLTAARHAQIREELDARAAAEG